MATKRKTGRLLRFYYQGQSHGHPVRRTVFATEETDTLIKGYEIREGSIVRTVEEAKKHPKTYRKDRIARYGDYCRLRMSKQTRSKKPTDSTLTPLPALALFEDGV